MLIKQKMQTTMAAYVQIILSEHLTYEFENSILEYECISIYRTET